MLLVFVKLFIWCCTMWFYPEPKRLSVDVIAKFGFICILGYFIWGTNAVEVILKVSQW